MQSTTVESSFPEYHHFIGLDEVGRGPLAGPVVCAGILACGPWAIHWPELGITDSKKISSKKRKRILSLFHWKLVLAKDNGKSCDLNLEHLTSWPQLQLFEGQYKSVKIFASLFSGDAAFIDKVNILQASLKGMGRCAEILIPKVAEKNHLSILVDGNYPAKLDPEFAEFTGIQRPIVQGDSKSLTIGLASILAKEFRDEVMREFDEVYPQYFFSSNKGYPSKAHLEALKIHGVTDLHRKSYAPVAKLVQY